MDAPTLIGASGIGVTIAIAFVTMVYHLGRFAARIESLESWRAHMDATLDKLWTELRSIRTAVTRDPP